MDTLSATVPDTIYINQLARTSSSECEETNMNHSLWTDIDLTQFQFEFAFRWAACIHFFFVCGKFWLEMNFDRFLEIP